MIVGSGLIARAFAPAFADDADVVIFASGVSNSSETDPAAFAREAALLREALARAPRRLVYFSTCSVHDPERRDMPYVRHKLAMEDLVRAIPGHRVLRLPQVVGSTPNPHTLTNYLCDCIVSGRGFEVWSHASRYLVDIDDVAAIGTVIARDPRHAGRTVNVASPEAVRVTELVAAFERVLGRRARCEYVNRGDAYAIDSSEALEIASALGLRFGPDYVERVIGKYYGHIRAT